MSTFNGFGTMYYGWHHNDDGSATATKWFAISWVPIIPLYRERLRVLTDFKNDRIKAELGGLFVSQLNKFEIIEKTPLAYGEIAKTYAKTYVGLPSLLFGPLLLVALLGKLAQQFGIDVKPGTPAFTALTVGIGVGLVNFLIQCVRYIRRARGWQPKL